MRTERAEGPAPPPTQAAGRKGLIDSDVNRMRKRLKVA